MPLASIRVGEDPATSETLPSHAYWDEGVHAAEMLHIHQAGWTFAGHVCELPRPGAYVVRPILGQGVLLLRAEDGAMRAFFNVCQHRGHELMQGAGEACRIVCPYHAWGYDLEGRLATGRLGDGPLRRADIRLRALGVGELHGLVFVNLDGKAPPLSQLAGELAADLAACVPGLPDWVEIGRHAYALDCNWKVMVENSLECLHCANAHPSFSRTVDLACYRSESRGHVTRHAGPMRAAWESVAEGEEYRYWHLFPTTEIHTVTGSPLFAVYSNRPLGPERIEVTGVAYGPPGLGAEARERLLADLRDNPTAREDFAIVESVQRGLRSMGYERGRYVVSDGHASEHSVHHFARMVAQALEGAAVSWRRSSP